jgi:hypothetical protein
MVEITASHGWSDRSNILTTSLESIQTMNHQIDVVSKEISNYTCRNNKNVRILLSITSLGNFSQDMRRRRTTTILE